MDSNDAQPRSQIGPDPQAQSDDVANLDNATFIEDLLGVVPYLVNLEQFIRQFVRTGRKQDVAEILGLLDQETMNSFIGTLRTKLAQMDGIRLHLRKNPLFPNRDLLEELLVDAQPKCRQTAESVARLKCSLAAENDDDCRDDDDHKDDKDDDDNDDDPDENRQSYVSSVLLQQQQQQQRPESPSTATASYATDEEQKRVVLDEDDVEASSPLTGSADPRSLPLPVVRLEQTGTEDQEEWNEEVEEQSASDDDDDDDEEGYAVKPRNSAVLSCSTALSVTDDWRESTVLQDPRHLKIRRKELLEDCIPFYGSVSRRSLRRILSVKFVGEPGIDMGALTREFFSLGFEAFISGTFKGQSLFEGERGHLLPYPGADCRVFSHLGKMIVHAVVNDCRRLPGLSPAIVHYLTNEVKITAVEDSHPPLTIDDVADQELNPILHKLESMEKLTPEELSSLENWMAESNCRIFLSDSPASRMLILQHLLIYYVFTKRLRQVEALTLGLNYLGLREFLIKNPSKKNVSFVFPSPEDVSITESALLAAIVTRGDPPGNSGGDVAALDLFVLFVRELHNSEIADYGLVDLVRFMTGSPYLPPRIVVSFRSDNLQLPMAHVCYNEIELPTVHRTYDEFRRAMITALTHGSSGFDMD